MKPMAMFTVLIIPVMTLDILMIMVNYITQDNSSKKIISQK
jgi:hypothetical protein